MRASPQHDEVRRRVMAWIGAQSHAHGARMPSERKLGELLQVRRTVLNEVLTELEREGVIRNVSPRVREIPPYRPDVAWNRTVLVACNALEEPPVDGIYTPNFGQLMMLGIRDVLHQHGLTPLVFRPDDAGCNEALTLLDHRPAAVVVPCYDMRHQRMCAVLEQAVQAGIPCVSSDDVLFVDEALPAGVDNVRSGQAEGEQMRVAWLAKRGFRRLQRLDYEDGRGTKRHQWWHRRQHGHSLACRALGLTELPELVLPSLMVMASWDNFGHWANMMTGALFEQLRGGKAPDAYLAISDGDLGYLAVACRRYGYDPNQRPRLIGFDGYWWIHPMCRFFEREGQYSPPMSIDMQFREQGMVLARQAIARIGGAPLSAAPIVVPARMMGPEADG